MWLKHVGAVNNKHRCKEFGVKFCVSLLYFGVTARVIVQNFVDLKPKCFAETDRQTDLLNLLYEF
jgi:hypothetical protein